MLLAFLSLAVALAAPHWSEAPPLSADPKVLLDAARAEQASLKREEDGPAPDVHILLEETVAEVAADGSYRYTYRMVFRPLTPEAARAWGTWEVGWDTWKETRPQLQARVIQEDGDVYTLDPALIAEGPLGDDPTLLSDSLKLMAPLPQLEAGAVIEEVIVIDKVSPLLAGQFYLSTYLERSHPVERRVVRVDAPRTVELREEIQGYDVEFKTRKDRERQVWELVVPDARAIPGVPPTAPLDVPRFASVVVSTAGGWGEVAAGYEAMVADVFDPAGLEPMLKPLHGLSRDAQIAGALAAVHARTRYTGVLFGETRIVPNPPKTTIQRGFGDCKDQSVLLVALLRALGIDAHLALLRVGYDEGIALQNPALNRFNHAIVHIPGDEPRWLDPTNPFVSADDIPEGLQGLPALVIRPGSAALVTIPYTAAKASLLREELTITLPYRGRGDLVEVTSATGSIAAWERQRYSGGSEGELESLTRAAKMQLQTEQVTAELTPATALDQPWRSRVAATGTGAAETGRGGAVVSPGRFSGFFGLPPLGDAALARRMGGEEKPVEHDILFTPYVYELALTIAHPAELAADLPAGRKEWKAGDTRLVQEVTPGAGKLQVTITFDSGSGRLTPADAAALRAIIAEFQPWPDEGIGLSHAGWAALREGDVLAAIPVFRAAVAEHPDDVLRRVDLVEALMTAGLMDAARRELAPIRGKKDVTVLLAEASLNARDRFGRLMEGGYDREAAVTAAEKAIDVDPENVEARRLLADLLQRNEAGVVLGAGSEPCKAARQLHYLIEDLSQTDLSADYLRMAMRCGKDKELAEWLEGVNGVPISAAKVALHARKSGAADAAAALARAGGQPEPAVVAQAAVFLIDSAEYDLAADLLRASSPQVPAAAREAQEGMQELAATLVKGADRSAPLSTPEGAMLGCIRAAGSGRPADLDPFLSASLTDPLERQQIRRMFLVRSGAELAPQASADLVAGMTDVTAEGSPEVGYRVAWRAELRGNETRATVYLVPEQGRLTILSAHGHRRPLAERAYQLAQAGKVDQALQWLEWAAEGMPAASARAPLEFYPWTHLLRLADPAQPVTVEAAALALLEEEQTSPARLRALEALRPKLSPAAAAQIDRALAMSSVEDGDRATSMAAVERLLQAYPGEPDLLWMQINLRIPDDPAAAVAAIAALPAEVGEERRLQLAADVAVHQGDFPAAVASFRGAMDKGSGSARNNMYWYSMFLPEIPDDLGQQAAAAYEDTSSPSLSFLHTVAMAEASSGRHIQALARLYAALDADLIAPEDLQHWWMVVGLISEAAGELDQAEAAYEAAPDHVYPSLDLSQRRLAAMRSGKPR